jgi:hypothetical protein
MSSSVRAGRGPLRRTVQSIAAFAFAGSAVALLSGNASAAPGVPADGRISFGQFYSEPNEASIPMGMSDDGRYITFSSYATNITDQVGHPSGNVYRFDKLAGFTELISVGTNGAEGNGTVGQIMHTTRMISPNGNLILFSSTSSNLVPNDTNETADVFVRDVGFFGMGATTTRVSLMNGSQIPKPVNPNAPNLSTSLALGMSNDAQRILFMTKYPISAQDGNGTWDVYLYNRTSSQTTLVSANAAGVAVGSTFATLSETGRYVSFLTGASLDGVDANGQNDVYRKDLDTGAIRFVSVGMNNTSPNGVAGFSTMSPDGRYVAFYSTAANIVNPDSNGAADVFVRDLTSNTVVRASTRPGFPDAASPGCLWFSISANGRYLAMGCEGNGLVPGDNNGFQDVFVKDLVAGDITLISRVAGGAAGDLPSGGPIISRNGNWITFASTASNFVTPDTLDFLEVFRASRQ